MVGPREHAQLVPAFRRFVVRACREDLSTKGQMHARTCKTNLAASANVARGNVNENLEQCSKFHAPEAYLA